MKRTLKSACAGSLFGLLLASTLPAHAQLHFNPIGKAPFLRTEAEIGGGSMETDIELDTPDGKVESLLERNYLYGSLALDIDEVVDAILGVAYLTTEDLLDSNGLNGFSASFGLRAEVFKKNASSIHAYGQVTYLDQTLSKFNSTGFYDDDPNSPALTSNEISDSGIESIIGAVYAHTIGSVTLFGGIEIVPYTRTSSEFYTKYDMIFIEEVRSRRLTHDFDRLDPVSGKIGARIAVGAGSIQADATLVGEENFRISFSYPL